MDLTYPQSQWQGQLGGKVAQFLFLTPSGILAKEGRSKISRTIICEILQPGIVPRMKVKVDTSTIPREAQAKIYVKGKFQWEILWKFKIKLADVEKNWKRMQRTCAALEVSGYSIRFQTKVRTFPIFESPKFSSACLAASSTLLSSSPFCSFTAWLFVAEEQFWERWEMIMVTCSISG